MAKRDRTPRADGWIDPNPRDEQLRRYKQEKARPTGRNLGPKGRHFFDNPRTEFFVVCDVELKEGTIVNGAPVPPGAVLKSWPLMKPLHSRRQARKALQKARHKIPSAYGMTCVRDGDAGTMNPGSLELPDAGRMPK